MSDFDRMRYNLDGETDAAIPYREPLKEVLFVQGDGPNVVYFGKGDKIIQKMHMGDGFSQTPQTATEKTGARKDDDGKPCIKQGLIDYFPNALWAVAEVSTFGAKKYAWNGWKDVENGENRYGDARFRHSLRAAMGEEVDLESGLSHLAHEAWGALAALELDIKRRKA